MTLDQFDEIAASVNHAIDNAGVLANQWQNESPLFAFLKGKAKGLDGGDKIRENLVYQKNSTGGSYSAYDTLDTSPSEEVGFAYYEWAQQYKVMAIDEATILKTSGKNQLVDLLTAKINNAKDSLFDDMATAAFAAGTGNGGKDMDGLALLMDATATLGGIAPTTYTWWVPQTDSTAVAMDTGWMNTMINNIKGSSGGDPMKMGVCDLILTTQTLYESFESLILPYARTSGTGVGNLGFTSLAYKGTEIAWDDRQTSGVVDFLSSKYMGLRYLNGRNFKLDGWRKPTNQDARVQFIFWMGNIVCNNRRRLGRATAKTA